MMAEAEALVAEVVATVGDANYSLQSLSKGEVVNTHKQSDRLRD